MPLKAGEAIAKEFCLVIISKCICVSLIGVESGSSRGVEERARRFETRWSFDRIRAVQEARRLIDEFGERVPPALGDQIAQRLHDAEQAVPRRIEARLTASFEQMVKRYQWVAGRVNELEDTNARLTASDDDDAPIATIERDEVTDVGNRNTLARFFGELMIDATTPRVAVAWLDVDDLDAINAQHGRGAGDMALKVVAETIASQVREEDCFVRWGDDEFVVVMPGMDIGAAKRRALELVEAVSWKAFPEPYRGVNLTVSCGVAVGDLPAIELDRLRDTVNRGRGGNRGRTIVGDYLTTT
jgi:diguanylate cyclase (GGDEF)-like protein